MVNPKDQAKQNLILHKFERDRLVKEINTLHQLSIQVSSDDSNIDEFLIRCSELKSIYQEFTKVQNEVIKILITLEQDIDLSPMQEIFDTVSQQYYAILTVQHKVTNNQISTTTSSSSLQSHQIETQVKLPKLQLPSFNGSIKDWPHFKDLYCSLIHNNDSISNIQKFQYLLSCLTSEPHNLARTLPVTSENYPIIWEQLVLRYDDKRQLAICYLDEIINLPSVYCESPKQLRNLLDISSENFTALNKIDFPVSLGDFILFHSVAQKLDKKSRQLFESQYSKCEFPTFQNLIDFLRDHCKSLDAAQTSSEKHKVLSNDNKPKNSQSQSKPYYSGFKTQALISSSSKHSSQEFNQSRNNCSTFIPQNNCQQTNITNNTEPICSFCQISGHKIYHCSDFEALTVDKRLEFVKRISLCTNCLRADHKYSNCTSKHLCFICKRKHHTLLHLTAKPSKHNMLDSASHKPTTSTCINASSTPENNTSQEICNTASASTNTTVVLGTTLVSLTNTQGNQMICRAVLDSASSSTFITKHVADYLHLKRNYANLPQVCGISSTQISVNESSYVNISTVNGHKVAVDHPVIVLDKITNHLPRVPISPKVKLLLKNKVLADPGFDTPCSIDLLIGADLFAQTLLGNNICLGKNLPTAMNTIFGYVIIGQSPSATVSSTKPTSNSMLCTHDNDLHNSIQRFWINEEPPHFSKPSKEEEQCEKLFKETHYRDTNGRYVVCLPFKESPDLLGDSSKHALKQFNNLEKGFDTKPLFKQKYVEFMNDYKESGHMQLCEEVPSGNKFFLPHHGVFKGDKIRVVFNASADTTSSYSLNDILHSGAKLHNNIFDIMFNFRRYKVVFSCDIRQMFRQILIDPSDRRYQLIYWREDPSQELSVYELNTVTYGMSCSPYLANRVIQQLIEDEGQQYPDLSTNLKNQIYVDDILLGADTIAGALQLQKNLIDLLSKGGFELRKWISNNEELLNHLPPEYCETSKLFSQSQFLNSDQSRLFSILGLKWSCVEDSFSYSIDITTSSFTKRSVLSQIAKIYDVMGFITPVVMWAKVLMQVIWTKGVSWDEQLPSELCNKWSEFVQDLPTLKTIQLARHLPFNTAKNIQLHGFCDASQQGYGCCVYLRCEYDEGETTMHLLFAKSRVAPLKQTSLPRLELCGAHLLSKLLKYCYEQLSPNYEISAVRAWCDSTITLSWIKTPSYKLKTYVANRVAEIQDNVPSNIWFHIPSTDNPADCASRGLLPSCLVNHSLWWHGPDWLRKPEHNWIQTNETLTPFNELPETKPQLNDSLLTTDNFDLLNRYSSWQKLLHVTAYTLRFIQNMKNPTSKNLGPLSLSEIHLAEQHIWKLVQKQCFDSEIKNLKSGKPCSTKLQRLAPFLDNNGILRVGGRLKHSSLRYDMKHPILVPKKHTVTNLLINYYHEVYLHCGSQQLRSLLNLKYWIVSARSVIRSQIFKCMQCFRNKPQLSSAYMGDLPAKRVVPTRPFLICGVDYAGPITVKLHALRRLQPIKVYLCIFVCFTTKAVHLETVTDLTSQSFIAALTRFISRRGMIQEIHSDNATNFVGASRALRTTFDNLIQQEETNRFLSKHAIKFNFIPPRAPHHGGVWERAIQSVKYHLRRVIGEQILTLEEFNTLLARVEAMLNSRPLTPVSEDPADLEALTPGHFLVGGPLVTLPEECLQDINVNRLRRWQLVQSFAQNIWRRWKQEYLVTLQQRSKWTKHKPNIKVGDMVLVHEDNIPPNQWNLGRVISVVPGNDNIVRVVRVKTSAGDITRPIVKVSLLPMNNE